MVLDDGRSCINTRKLVHLDIFQIRQALLLIGLSRVWVFIYMGYFLSTLGDVGL